MSDNLGDGADIGLSLSEFLFAKVFGSTNLGSTDFSLSQTVAKQIRNTIINMLPCELTVEDFSCIIDSAVNKYKE